MSLTFRCSNCGAFNQLTAASPGECAACDSLLDVSGKPQEVDAAALARAVASSPVPVFVDFWAPWCGPCLMAAPIVKALGAKMAGEIVLLSVDTQAAPEAGEQHAIYALPTFALFQSGEEIAREMGLLPRNQMERWVRGAFAPASDEARG